jgi:hypothetical protein
VAPTLLQEAPEELDAVLTKKHKEDENSEDLDNGGCVTELCAVLRRTGPGRGRHHD